MSTSVNIDLETPVAEKDKDARKRLTFDLKDIMAVGDTLASCVWTVLPAGLTIVSSSVAGTVAALIVSGGAESTWYNLRGHWVGVSGDNDDIVVRLFVKADAENISPLGTALFPNRYTAVQRMRADRLLMAASGLLPTIAVSDDYLWDKLRAAEAEAQQELRVFFAPTTLFPLDPTQAEIDALMGTPYAVDPGYDWGPENFEGEKWGLITLRHRPVQSITRVYVVYPAPTAVAFDYPLDWMRTDKKYGHIRIVPTTSLSLLGMSASLMALFTTRTLPQAMRINYVAGLANAARDYPQLIDLVQKKAMLKIIGDRFMPQSGSISADGLSQSLSVDMSKYEESTDAIMNGMPGGNGGLKAAIHGVRMVVC